MPGAQCTRSLVCDKKQTHERSHHRSTGFTRHSRTQWFYGLFRALPGDEFVLSPSSADKVSSARLGRLASANLTPATGARTTRLCRPRKASFVCVPFVSSRAVSTHPAIPWHRPTLPRPPHPIPTFVTMANAPARGRDGGSSRFDLG